MAKKATTGKPLSELRIVGGKHRSRKLKVVDVEGLRPTGDRMREVVFNWLMPWINGARVLDLFAGSGALGIEAVSRGAQTAVFVEKDAAAFAVLKENTQILDAAEYELARLDAADYLLQRSVSAIDIVFVDPPFAQSLWSDVLSVLSSALPEHAIVYLEAPSNHSFDSLHGFEWIKHKRQGQVQFGLLQKLSHQ
ncbi:MAG: 16S rRNA (guanine(966)-N(2))-methyltransferase RsmD [Gammaproteobacteria bacterium]|nr:16S rRNA (guanine(966)-N(2))-methyltransferase RsmD [Gammaproteobacteria bacterium]